MFWRRCPSSQEVEQFLDDSRSLPLSYGRIGITREDRPRGRLDEHVVIIGHGSSDFERASRALEEWKHFDLSWVRLFPRHASIDVGTIVAVRIRHLGFWSLNGARVVYQVKDASRFGFAYGTLTNHAEHGEELFEVSIDPQTGEVAYRIRAVSWPQALLARMGYALVRHMQARFRRDSAAAMAPTPSASPTLGKH
jgi:uncharacterized protein (UPF0548 family)